LVNYAGNQRKQEKLNWNLKLFNSKEMTILDAIIISILLIQRFVYLRAQKGSWRLALLSSKHVLQYNIFCTFIWTWVEPNCA